MSGNPFSSHEYHRGLEEAKWSKICALPEYAEGSLAETEYLLVVSRDLGYLAAKDCDPLMQEISEIARMLYALRTKVSET